MSFLTPQDRALLLDSLRPPDGYKLHTAIGTTYSLDLVALLTAPVGFTFFELGEAESGVGEQAPLELLEAIRRHASQILLFCEAGRIAVPPKHRPLFSFLEDRIVQARAPNDGGAFHPKVWAIRYVDEEERVRYRLLCMSRNLTFDRSLDTMLVLDGDLRDDRTQNFGYNKPLRQFFAALPGMAVGELSMKQAEQCQLIASEVGRVEWELEGLPAEEIAFWPLGCGAGEKDKSPFWDPGTRLLVASPFVSDRCLQELAENGADHILISRQHELDRLDPETLDAFREIFVLRSDLEVEERAGGSEEGVAAHDIHAKLYIADRGWKASVWTGSANATNWGFDGNVEFLVELGGKKSQLGIDTFLKKQTGVLSMPDLLQPYRRPDAVEADADAEALDEALGEVRRALAVLPWTVAVRAGPTSESYAVDVSAGAELPVLTADIRAKLRLVSLNPETASVLQAGGSMVTFPEVSLESLTSFLVFDVTATRNGKSRAAQFVVNARLVGDPPNRRDRLLRAMLSDRRAVVRYLLLLLSEVHEEAELSLGVGSTRRGRGSADAAAESEALLEPLLRAFARDPGRLDAVASVIGGIASASETADLVPDGLEQLVEVLDAARREVTA